MSEVRTPGGRRIFYDEVGSGPPVLVLTGSGVGRRFVGPMLPALAARCRVVAPDNRDAGESEPEPTYYTAADMAADAAALLDALGIGRTHIVGVSMGGIIALQLALDHPARVDRLVLESTPLPGEGHRPGEPLPPPDDWWSDDPVERAHRLLPELAGPADRARLSEADVAAAAERERGNRITWAGLMRQAAATSGYYVRGSLAQVRAPTLVIHGELDEAVPLADGEALAAGIPGARMLVLPGAGHAILFEQAEEVNRAILAFLGLEGQGAPDRRAND